MRTAIESPSEGYPRKENTRSSAKNPCRLEASKAKMCSTSILGCFGRNIFDNFGRTSLCKIDHSSPTSQLTPLLDGLLLLLLLSLLVLLVYLRPLWLPLPSLLVVFLQYFFSFSSSFFVLLLASNRKGISQTHQMDCVCHSYALGNSPTSRRMVGRWERGRRHAAKATWRDSKPLANWLQQVLPLSRLCRRSSLCTLTLLTREGGWIERRRWRPLANSSQQVLPPSLQCHTFFFKSTYCTRPSSTLQGMSLKARNHNCTEK